MRWKYEVMRRAGKILLLIYRHVADNNDGFDDETVGYLELLDEAEKEKWIIALQNINADKK